MSYNDGESAAYQTYWITEKDRKTIKDFTKNGEESPHSAILGWQQYEKHRKETDRIDDEMAIIPEIPKDFEEWAKKDAVPQYMYYESGKKIGRCTCCGKTQELSGHKYGQEGKCKYCKRKVIYKTYKKNPNIKGTWIGRCTTIQTSRPDSCSDTSMYTSGYMQEKERNLTSTKV